ncbi:putative peptidoglycan binding protein [Jatrophihabitans sp. GAS493]|uniref:peptidoglycan-binding domain-containing protein n=1 Tax=Jatrophihabitans sp. GAS493 TaxID=1907575 RepID=UPI000BC0E435|nr:peptidoglycan-binding domain-containing protein [Jatrophihabitans sp. GAS493]SOD74242.1 putative peptidoglycan binding protein [Jatrophihabitans sp. GAS493]
MNTNTTPQNNIPQSTTARTTGRAKKSPALIAVVSALGVAALAGVIGTLMFAFSAPASAHHDPAQHKAPAAAVTPVRPAAPGQITPIRPVPAHHTISPANPATPTNAKPTAAVRLLQQQLGQLNYYEGPVNGVMNVQTVQAIEYLQRDAGLTQTGTLNAPTDVALAHYLVDGNNQMAG